MDKLPSNIIQLTYEYDNTYNIKFAKVLKQLSAHCFIYNCQICVKPYNNCCCNCVVCKAYLNFCQQIYYDQYSTYEDELADVIQLGF